MTIETLNNVPKKPGVYLWKDLNGNILYIGKANDLNSRMKQYFQGSINSYKTSLLIKQIEDFDYIITHTNNEALLLEKQLIDTNNPPFNILLKDDKRYPYIVIYLSGNKLIIKLQYRIFNKKDKLVFGPFPTGSKAKKIVDILNRLACYEKGILVETNDRSFWEKQYQMLQKLLSQGVKSLINNLQKQMIIYADNEQYELAQDIKETINSLGYLNEKQVVQLNENEEIDVLGIVKHDTYLSITLLFYRHGTILSKKEFLIEHHNQEEETLRHFINEYYKSNYQPNKILANFAIDSLFHIDVPLKGTYKKIVDLAITNANNEIKQKILSYQVQENLSIKANEQLRKLLNLKSLQSIVMIDNSNLHNTNVVSALIYYKYGQPIYNKYRKFLIDTISDPRLADVAYMKQGMEKYFKNNDQPDLLIVDGGKAQVNEIKKLYPHLQIIGLVKNEFHKTKSLINLQGQEISIQDQYLFSFLSKMQIEVDKYAKNFHNKRRITSLEGKLKSIPGIGDVIEQKLLNYFKTYSAIYNASIQELEKVVSNNIAKKIKKGFK